MSIFRPKEAFSICLLAYAFAAVGSSGIPGIFVVSMVKISHWPREIFETRLLRHFYGTFFAQTLVDFIGTNVWKQFVIDGKSSTLFI